VLPEVERLLTKTDEYESLWRSAWEKIAIAMESFERGTSHVTEFADARLSLVTLSPEVFSPSGFNPTRHAAPYTAISRYAKGELFLITTPVKTGWVYRIDYPYYSWAETIVRPRIARRDFSGLLSELNQLEREGEGVWKLDNSEMTSAIKFLDSDDTLASSRLMPEEVAKLLNSRFALHRQGVAST
jgi:hypothetical protein